MQDQAWQRPATRLPLRPEAFRVPGRPAAAAGRGTRPKVLVSFGTVFANPAVLGPILRELSTMDVDIVATADPDGYEVERVAFVGFTPMSELLDGVDVVITHGGAGTTFGTLSRGIPLVVVPQGADNFIQAERVAASGAGVALPPDAAPRAVAKAAGTVLGDIRIREAAAAVGKEIDSMPTPGEVAATLAAAVG
ncbi:glycosyltransferase [Amycolatopsis sp. CA-230715]|uniref:glycosyltransferase n=1 Tax=Amycolatopsis sp. CA-230715 TaxID=2745196 RepID=UPI001C010C8F|nr:nucleotide disphospho-sugar-binding domain-containing protein [Amycolatopsis sp. CA-230715]QWF79733.1 L-demethylnoviosyl transferase [Amycolatopsis sp. CA-230715]